MSEAVSDLCQACGFCCDGTLFEALRVTARDAERLTPRRLPLFQDEREGEGGEALRLPCPAHVGACTIYEDRPTICRTYQCELVNRLERGDIDREGALLRVARLRGLIDAIRPHLDAPGDDFWARADALQARPFAWQIEHEALMLQIATLREMLAHFIDARSRRAAPTS